MSNQRKSPRTAMKVRIRIDHPQHGELLVNTRDISDSGVFVLMDGSHPLQVGERVAGQVQGLPMEAPIVQMEVVRLESMGVGLRFIRD
jgi:hypothetical protein